jgi:hypothetical protein
MKSFFIILPPNDAPLAEDNVPEVLGSVSPYRFTLQRFSTFIRGYDEGVGKRGRKSSEGVTEYLRKVFAGL